MASVPAHERQLAHHVGPLVHVDRHEAAHLRLLLLVEGCKGGLEDVDGALSVQIGQVEVDQSPLSFARRNEPHHCLDVLPDPPFAVLLQLDVAIAEEQVVLDVLLVGAYWWVS